MFKEILLLVCSDYFCFVWLCVCRTVMQYVDTPNGREY